MEGKRDKFEGKTVEEAILAALEELGMEREEVHVEILEEPHRGFLGIGGKRAIVRVQPIGEYSVTGTKEGAYEAGEGEIGQIEVKEEEWVEEARPPSIKPKRMAEKILDLMGIEGEVEQKDREDSIIVDIWSDDVALLIGRGGSTLDAVQYLMNIACWRTGEVDKRIVVDAEGYRKRRKARLESYAESMAEKAIRSRREIRLDPMNASERRIVHISIRGKQRVRTESEGEEPERRVIIIPED